MYRPMSVTRLAHLTDMTSLRATAQPYRAISSSQAIRLKCIACAASRCCSTRQPGFVHLSLPSAEGVRQRAGFFTKPNTQDMPRKSHVGPKQRLEGGVQRQHKERAEATFPRQGQRDDTRVCARESHPSGRAAVGAAEGRGGQPSTPAKSRGGAVNLSQSKRGAPELSYLLLPSAPDELSCP